MIRYGILSTAQVVPRFVKGVEESQKGIVTAIASRGIEKAQKMAQKLAIPRAFGSYEELCQSTEVDIVYIAVYNKGHYDAAKLALMNHKHVLLEKPFTMTLAQAEELFLLAQERGLFLMEAQKSLFLPITKQVQQAINTGKIGTIHWLDAVMAYPNIDHTSWFRDLSAGGGVFRGAGTYPLEYMQYLLAALPEEYQGMLVFPDGQSDAQAQITLRFPKEIVGTLFLTVELDLKKQLIIYGEKGKIIVPDFWKTATAEIHYADGQIEELSSTQKSEFVFEIDHVNDCLERGLLESPIVTKELTLKTVAITEAIYENNQK
ncbi:Gfo/Idh/MocA family protein [Enterococcus dongliensis]|uniref:Gfo/Idh/MocA family protein n=1 Tax=Enterococcus dongliensis TaxID=2559925 RepID=UPI00288F8236|nr:Gfo/Idh/MocA family oxidoreductase [Enterococcus dongliensis]MDT2604128.1 Gfo/Idh/MocA family oxidoreductase [Enterococcus dongliensis]MDT2711551.1 Gfo/Idh/MocA family oxidoreductase [Enterococcus dongliensis]